MSEPTISKKAAETLDEVMRTGSADPAMKLLRIERLIRASLGPKPQPIAEPAEPEPLAAAEVADNAQPEGEAVP